MCSVSHTPFVEGVSDFFILKFRILLMKVWKSHILILHLYYDTLGKLTVWDFSILKLCGTACFDIDVVTHYIEKLEQFEVAYHQYDAVKHNF